MYGCLHVYKYVYICVCKYVCKLNLFYLLLVTQHTKWSVQNNVGILGSGEILLMTLCKKKETKQKKKKKNQKEPK